MQQSTHTKNTYSLLAASLLAMGLGQLLLSFGRDFIEAQQPIDWAHWLIFAGAVGTAASFFRMRLGRLGKIAKLLVVAGMLGFVGMVAIDIVLWTVPGNPVTDDALDAALVSPQVAIPFLWVGPSLFFVGLALKAAEWWRGSAGAAALIIIGTLLSGFGQAVGNDSITLFSFVCMLGGLALLWRANP
jgi:hypothetical protein